MIQQKSWIPKLKNRLTKKLSPAYYVIDSTYQFSLPQSLIHWSIHGLKSMNTIWTKRKVVPFVHLLSWQSTREGKMNVVLCALHGHNFEWTIIAHLTVVTAGECVSKGDPWRIEEPESRKKKRQCSDLETRASNSISELPRFRFPGHLSLVAKITSRLVIEWTERFFCTPLSARSVSVGNLLTRAARSIVRFRIQDVCGIYRAPPLWI
jgi:hypothetical protein